MGKLKVIRQELNNHAVPEKAAPLAKFFQVFPGGYGEGDRFIGVTVPNQHRIARKYYRSISLIELEDLMRDPVHECRLTAILILVLKFEKAKTETEKQSVVDYYLGNIDYINNWDLVDSSAHKIVGAYLFNKDRNLLYNLARSGELWQQRIAVLSTFYFIRNGDYTDSLEIAGLLLNHEHDLIHKAVGWMLREVGNRDFATEYNFLKKHYQIMPRTMLRYAIEKFDPALRKKFLIEQV